jgi:hypothetical protein
MPKSTVYVRNGPNTRSSQVGKIGGRSSLLCVKTMSMKDLLKTKENLNTRPRDFNKINNEIARRTA